jgi:hypothetical protein
LTEEEEEEDVAICTKSREGLFVRGLLIVKLITTKD